MVSVVSKSLFILLYSVTLLSVVASLQSGDLRSGEAGFNPRAELRADVASFKADMRVIVRRLQDMPLAFHALWEDAREDLHTLKADAAVETKSAARRISTLIKTTS